MTRPDLNLLYTLEALLTEGSVAGAARRLRLSPSAMSRSLARLREVTGDPLLVRAGRGLVPTPRAFALRDRIGGLVQEAEAALRPSDHLDLSTLERTFTLRASEGFVETFGPALLGRLRAEAPGVRLRFIAKPDRSSGPLRDGSVDLETGVIGADTSPEVRAQALFRDRFIGVMRADHPLSALLRAGQPLSLAVYCQADHVCILRPGQDRGPVDGVLAALGRQRLCATMVGGFSAALALVRSGALIATVPERHTAALRDGLLAFVLPFAMPEITVSLLWHPRQEADPAHRWLRQCVQDICQNRG